MDACQYKYPYICVHPRPLVLDIPQHSNLNSNLTKYRSSTTSFQLSNRFETLTRAVHCTKFPQDCVIAVWVERKRDFNLVWVLEGYTSLLQPPSPGLQWYIRCDMTSIKTLHVAKYYLLALTFIYIYILTPPIHDYVLTSAIYSWRSQSECCIQM